jgi:hypothetical protein
MVVWLEIETWVIGKGGTKRWGRKRGGVDGEEVWELLGFGALVYVWVYICCCSGGFLCQGCRGLEVCTIDTVG